MINKIIITGDMLRPSISGEGSNQKINIDWLYNLLKNPLNLATELPVEILNWEEREGSFNSKLFYKLNGLDSMPEDWITLYKTNKFSNASLGYLSTFLDNALVVGFELPDIFMNMFDKLNIPYIDIIIHPIRYLDDIFFGIRTNRKEYFERLKKFQLNTNRYTIQAGIHSATISRMPKLNIEKNSVLFTGQVEIDKSLLRNGDILSILDFKEEFKNLSSKYNKIYYKKHPYAQGTKEIDDFLDSLDNVEYIEGNFYQLLGQENLKSVYSISSSTVLEAFYFGKRSQFLYQSPFLFSKDNDNTFDSKFYIPIYNKYLEIDFWSYILGYSNNKEFIDLIPYKSNRLRNSIQNYWGYNFLDSEILNKHTRG